MPARKFKRRRYRVKRKPGRKPRPWLLSPLPLTYWHAYLHARHKALMEALKPYVLADLQERMDYERARGRIDAGRKYTPLTVEHMDIFLFALETTCKRLRLNVDQIVNQYIDREQKKLWEEVLFGRED